MDKSLAWSISAGLVFGAALALLANTLNISLFGLDQHTRASKTLAFCWLKYKNNAGSSIVKKAQAKYENKRVLKPISFNAETEKKQSPYQR